MWTPGTSNIGSEGGRGVGFLWQDPLCNGEGREGGHRLPLQSLPSAFSVWNVGQNPVGALERHDSSYSGWRGRILRETNSSTECQMRKKCCRLAEDHGNQRRLPGGGMLEVSFEVKLCRE